VLRLSFLPNGTQLVSAASNGVLKLWNIRTSDCANTFDKHQDKIWCVDVADGQLLTCGSDCQLVLWKDTTDQYEIDKSNLAMTVLKAEGQIDRLAKGGRLYDGLSLGLSLKYQSKMRKLIEDYGKTFLENLVGTDAKNDEVSPKTNLLNSDSLGKWIRSLSMEELSNLVGYITQWNCNAKSSLIASGLLKSILTNFGPETLTKVEGFNTLCNAFCSYAERHTQRIDSLIERSYLLDLILKWDGYSINSLN